MSCAKNTSAHPHNDKSLFGFNFESKKSSSTENMSCIKCEFKLKYAGVKT